MEMNWNQITSLQMGSQVCGPMGMRGKIPLPPYGSLWTHQSFYLFLIIYLIDYLIIYLIIFYAAITSTYIKKLYLIYREFTPLPPSV